MRNRSTTLPERTVSARDVIDLVVLPDADHFEVAYATVDSPLGPVTLAASRLGLVGIAYGSGRGALTKVKVKGAAVEAPSRLDEARLQLEEYFDGRRREFDVPIDWTRFDGFSASVLKATAEIPFGQTLSYREVAEAAGNPKASRAAGNALGANPIPIVIPCHRVLRSDGSIGGYTGGVDKKKVLLEVEGLSIP